MRLFTLKTFAGVVLVSLLFPLMALGQGKTGLANPQKPTVNQDQLKINFSRPGVPPAPVIFEGQPVGQISPRAWIKQATGSKSLLLEGFRPDGTLIAFSGRLTPKGQTDPRPLEAQVQAYLELAGASLQIRQPAEEFRIQEITTDALGFQHIRLQQQFKGIPVFGGGLMLHHRDGAIESANGVYYPSPALATVQARVNEATALQKVKAHLGHWKEKPASVNAFFKQPQVTSQLVIYHVQQDSKQEKLAWHLSVYPDPLNHWEYFIDAMNGDVLERIQGTCAIHGHGAHAHPVVEWSSTPRASRGPAAMHYDPTGGESASGVDLLGVNRNFQVYRHTNNQYYMIDISRSMFKTNSAMPDDPNGAIWTIDANNTTPADETKLNLTHIANTNNSWNAKSVSAHYNGAKAYEYFNGVHGRNAIDGRGSTILSVINVSEDDGSSMDNAFWNGVAIWYGNGNDAFRQPLQRGLDVAGHEMSHGVIQHTANLTYQNESGALNESFADIFGILIDRDDWTVGEDVVNTSVFKTGAMRSFIDPHNGGSAVGQTGYQPKVYSERYTGSADNGGVHINSGIVNHAFYLFASNANVGLDKAEKVYYRALTNYLTASSKFIDARVALEKAATDLYGVGSTQLTALQNAFTAVGIGSGGGGGGGGNPGAGNLPVNPGNDLLAVADKDLNTIQIYSGTNGSSLGVLTQTAQKSRPSVTDDGSAIVYVGEDGNVYLEEINWGTGNVTKNKITSDGVWRNVAISRDGNRLALSTGDINANTADNLLYIYDGVSQQTKSYELYNPTFTEGITTGDVLYCDVLEWDYSGEYVMYDAYNRVDGQFGDINFWDVGFIQVWNSATGKFRDGQILKLYPSLPDDISIGNPTFAKTTQSVIALDVIDDTGFNTEYTIYGINLETNDEGVLYENAVLGYPSYSKDDKRIAFSANTTSGNPVVGSIAVDATRIKGTGNASVLVNASTFWQTWFANGSRPLTGAPQMAALPVSLSPNPAADHCTIQWNGNNQEQWDVQITDLTGKQVYQHSNSGTQLTVTTSNWTPGWYWVKCFNSTGIFQGVLIVD